MTEIENRLVQYRPLVSKISSVFIRRVPSNVERDDLIQAGMIALMEALPRFKENQGATIETYLGRRIRGAMIDELRRQDWLSRTQRDKVGDEFVMTSLDMARDNGESWIDNIVAADNVEGFFANRQMREALVAEIKKLPQRESEIMGMIYEQDMPMIEVAAVMNLSPARISQIHAKTLELLKVRMRRAGF